MIPFGGYFSLPPPGVVLHQSGGIFSVADIPCILPPVFTPSGGCPASLAGIILNCFICPVFKGGGGVKYHGGKILHFMNVVHLSPDRKNGIFPIVWNCLYMYTNLNNVFINSFMHTLIYCKCIILILIHTTVIVFSFR